MKFEEVLQIADHEPIFESGLLLAGNLDPNNVRRQLSRWVDAGRLVQLRRGLYTLADPFVKVRPHPFVVANRLAPGSYVSCQSVLGHNGWIPEYVPVTTSVGPGRTRRWDTVLGAFDFRHLHNKLLFGFEWTTVARGQKAFVAVPEKALLDLVHLTPEGDSGDYLEELRLQNLERLDLAALEGLAERSGRPKLRRAARRIQRIAESESGSYETL